MCWQRDRENDHKRFFYVRTSRFSSILESSVAGGYGYGPSQKELLAEVVEVVKQLIRRTNFP